jgi:hypothetical protein
LKLQQEGVFTPSACLNFRKVGSKKWGMGLNPFPLSGERGTKKINS